ncbi:hypothetical protein JMA_42260 (plasmid) [Jeotgalibacillus malaysiensis]|uniref:Uncharacterized protein n=1 Tax=Jeotgalibacillus malaysiensis TaxID=1508404 RepID=A0A0B5AYF7_9BACL|nr:hypothetical protein [Jeotgalibacillus malaysiensis]AJD93543.1 hypothetical protein JMA_42260 [Jeotgalibacillus malaysiensis]
MSNNWKYTMQKHRGKIWLGGSLLATAVVAGGVWLVVSEDSPFSETKEAVSYLADYSIMAKASGDFHLVKVSNGETISQFKIESATPLVFQASADHETLYAFNGDELFAVKGTDGEVIQTSVVNGIGKPTPSRFATDGSFIATYDEKKKSLDVVDVATKTTTTVSDVPVVKDMLVKDGVVFYLTDKELVQVKDGKENRIEVGETLTSIQVAEGNLVLHSTFGQEKGENIVLYVNAETLDIENLQKTGATDTVMLQNDDGESYIHVGHYVNSETPGYQFTRFGVGTSGLEKDELALRIPTETSDIVFTSKNSVVDKDYIYMHSTSGLKVFDVKTQAVTHDIPFDVDYAMPILIEKEEEVTK